MFADRKSDDCNVQRFSSTHANREDIVVLAVAGQVGDPLAVRRVGKPARKEEERVAFCDPEPLLSGGVVDCPLFPLSAQVGYLLAAG